MPLIKDLLKGILGKGNVHLFKIKTPATIADIPKTLFIVIDSLKKTAEPIPTIT